MTTTDGRVPWAALPKELFGFYVIAPILFAPVLERDIFDLPRREVALVVAENFVPFLVLPTVLHALYHWVVPLVPPPAGLGRRILFHLALSVAVAAPVSQLIRPLMGLIRGEAGPPASGFAASCVVITWVLLIPSLIVMELRGAQHHTALRLRQQELAAQHAQIEALGARVAPHFLFNALNTVASLIDDEPAKAQDTTLRIAEILRYALTTARRERVPLREELAVVEDYLEVQRARFGERLCYHLDVDPEAERCLVPPLILQPLVENAVLHGIAPRVDGGRVTVAARGAPGKLVLTVTDACAGETSDTPRNGTGTSLADLRARLALIYDGESDIELSPRDGGHAVEITLPWRLE